MKRGPRRLFLGVLLGLLMAALGRAADLAQLRTFEEANRRLANAKTADEYYAVAALYRSILDAGTVSGAVLYNLGNCWLAAGEPGRAIACYLQAKRYRPRDPLLLNNLGQALLATGQSEPADTILDHVLFWQDWLSYREKAWLVGLLATFAFVCGLLAFRFGRRFRSAAWFAILLFLIAGGSLAIDAFQIEWTEHGVVVRDEVTARMGNSEGFATAFNEPLREGARFVVLERQTGWVRIRLPNGLDGWVRADDAVYF